MLRHDYCRDNFDPSWVKTVVQPWDLALIDVRLSKAFRTNHKPYYQLGFSIY